MVALWNEPLVAIVAEWLARASPYASRSLVLIDTCRVWQVVAFKVGSVSRPRQLPLWELTFTPTDLPLIDHVEFSDYVAEHLDD